MVEQKDHQEFLADLKQRINEESCQLFNCLPCRLYHSNTTTEKSGHLYNLRVAAVLIGIQFDLESKSWQYLLTLRNGDMRRNAGETCFPGGMVESADQSVVQTALREAQEEIGLKKSDCEVLGVLPPQISLLGVLVHQVVAVISSDFIPKPNQHEVTDVFYVNVNRVCEGDNHTQLCMTFYGENVGSNYYQYEYKGHMYTIYGLTGAILSFLSCIIGEPATSCQHCMLTRQLLSRNGGMCQLLHKFLYTFNTDGKLWSFKLLREADISEINKLLEDSKPKTISRL